MHPLPSVAASCMLRSCYLPTPASPAPGFPCSLALTKLDILDSFPEIKVGMEYLLEGKPISYFPANLELLNKVSVNCKTLPCQQCSTEQARSSASLPSQAQSYVYFIECYLGVPVKWVSVGKFCDSIKIF